MNKELIKLAVVGLVFGSCVASCSSHSDKSANIESDESSCGNKSGCKGEKDSNSSCAGKSGCNGS